MALTAVLKVSAFPAHDVLAGEGFLASSGITSRVKA